jgi:hypothetical protein
MPSSAVMRSASALTLKLITFWTSSPYLEEPKRISRYEEEPWSG